MKWANACGISPLISGLVKDPIATVVAAQIDIHDSSPVPKEMAMRRQGISETEAARPGGRIGAEANLMLIVHVQVHVKPESVVDFRQASAENARSSIQEPGIVRFDVLQQQDDATRFVLVEVYRSADAAAAHKDTAHYAKWRDAVAPMMAEPRYSHKYSAVFPDPQDW